MTTDHIIETLRYPGTVIPEAELAEVIKRKEEFVPILIAEIEAAIRSPEAVDPDDCFPAFALYLLAEMRESQALPLVLELFTCDLGSVEHLLGDVPWRDGDRFLAGLAQGRPEVLRGFVRRPESGGLSVGFALDALVLQVHWGEQPRSSVVEFFQELVETNHFGDDEDRWSYLVSASETLQPRELLNGFRELYERGLVDELLCGTFADLEESVQADAAAHMAQNGDSPGPIVSTAEAVAWWSCFAGPEAVLAGPGSGLPDLDSFSEDDLAQMKELSDLLDEASGGGMLSETGPPTIDLPPEPIRVGPKIGRNDQCPCGSGKKYKKCCLPPG